MSMMHESLSQYLQRYFQTDEVVRILLIKTSDLEGTYRAQLEFLSDARLENITVGVVPDDLWKKGTQPSESDAERQLILVKQSYFEAPENTDEIAWICHELAHCQYFFECGSAEKYAQDMQSAAFPEIGLVPYPNNLVERHAFAQQFEYLKRQGKTKDDILKLLQTYYDRKDFDFFNRLLS